MKLTTRQDIEVPLDFVWQELTDFAHFEYLAARRGVTIERVDHRGQISVGMGWRLKFNFRKKTRKALIRLAEILPGQTLDFGIESPSLAGGARIELLALAPKRTRLTMIADVKPRTIAARLVIQGMRIARGRTQRKLDSGSAMLAQMIRERWRAARH